MTLPSLYTYACADPAGAKYEEGLLVRHRLEQQPRPMKVEDQQYLRRDVLSIEN